ncbi:MAG: cupin domain-containing protein [Nitrososphaerota archaeon]
MVKIWRRERVNWVNVRDKVSAIPLSNDENCLLMMFSIKAGGEVPIHSHPQSQYGIVVSGRGFFTTKYGRIMVSEGDSYLIPSNEEHGFRAIQDVVVIDIFVPPRTDYIPLTRSPDLEA